MDSREIYRVDEESPELQVSDTTWLQQYGVDQAWQDNPPLITELNDRIALGSQNILVNTSVEQAQKIIDARLRFMHFAQVPEAVLAHIQDRRPTLVPTSTFITTQRTLCELGLDAAKVVNGFRHHHIRNNKIWFFFYG